MGDPCGIGPEVIVKALSHGEVHEVCVPIVIGSAEVIRRDLKFVRDRLDLALLSEEEIPDYTSSAEGRVAVLDLRNFDPPSYRPGQLSAGAGLAAAQCIEKAVQLAMDGIIHGITTAPINKAALNMAGYHFQGHTEFLAHLTDNPSVVMMLAGEKLRVTFVTTHAALRDIPDMITLESVLRTIRITWSGLRMMGIEEPRIAVAALNPHSGEGGVFGDEEMRVIEPAIERAKGEGIDVQGPFPADTLFVKAKEGVWDAVVTMYHDQGGIPVKMLEFEKVVNITLGLPIIRTSVGHGTAFDIAGKGIADERNMISAIMMAARLARSRFS